MTAVNTAWLDRFAALGDAEPPAKKLAMLLRSTFISDAGKVLVWGDWSAIEARVLPWLACAEEMLDIFRTNDANPKLPDIYKITAGKLLHKDPLDVTSNERQAYGKVPVLSLGFGGGLGALQAMATNYGVYLDDATAKQVVTGWREENAWARRFWGSHDRNGSHGLWGAVNKAVENPDTIYEAGRVAYFYDPDHLKGTLFCALPCGRVLTYPRVKWEWREVESKQTGKLEDRYQLTFMKGYGRVALWHGKCAENVTQAFAASILRRTLKRLDRDFGARMPVVMHTHDEIAVEVDEAAAGGTMNTLRFQMELNDDYDAGLPLKAEVSSNWYYTKAKMES